MKLCVIARSSPEMQAVLVLEIFRQLPLLRLSTAVIPITDSTSCSAPAFSYNRDSMSGNWSSSDVTVRYRRLSLKLSQGNL